MVRRETKMVGPIVAARGALDLRGARLPRSERPGMVFLSRDEFALVRDSVTEHWRPLVEFLTASGARFGEVAALRPSDVDRDAATVSITRAWRNELKKCLESAQDAQGAIRRKPDAIAVNAQEILFAVRQPLRSGMVVSLHYNLQRRY